METAKLFVEEIISLWQIACWFVVILATAMLAVAVVAAVAAVAAVAVVAVVAAVAAVAVVAAVAAVAVVAAAAAAVHLKVTLVLERNVTTPAMVLGFTAPWLYVNPCAPTKNCVKMNSKTMTTIMPSED